MRTATAVLLVAAAALACRGRNAPVQRTQQQYDVVQEGQTSSATSTIDAPGEVRPPIATATNTDTTGSFTLPATIATPPQQPATTPGAMASGMPVPAPPPRSSGSARAPAQQVPVVVTTTPPHTDTTTTASSDTAPPADTATTEAPPPADTTATEKPKKDTVPPPPTQTDTIGSH